MVKSQLMSAFLIAILSTSAFARLEPAQSNALFHKVQESCKAQDSKVFGLVAPLHRQEIDAAGNVTSSEKTADFCAYLDRAYPFQHECSLSVVHGRPENTKVISCVSSAYFPVDHEAIHRTHVAYEHRISIAWEITQPGAIQDPIDFKNPFSGASTFSAQGIRETQNQVVVE